MAWRIEIDAAAVKDLRRLGNEPTRRIRRFLVERLARLDDPRAIGEALKGIRLGHLWKYRVGDYRIIAEIRDDVVCVIIVKVGHRRDIYST